MRRKGTKPSTACHQEEGPPPSEDGALSEGEKEQPDCEVDRQCAFLEKARVRALDQLP